MHAVLLAFGIAAALAAPGVIDSALGQGMSGGMREHMREMMRGLVPPPGMTAETLPDPTSEGAKLLARFCTQCHDLPSPRYKTIAQWPPVFARMFTRMQAMARGGMTGRVQVPSAEEAHTLLSYLRSNAMRVAQPDELNAGDSADRTVFAFTCAGCHALPSPGLHAPEEWAGVVARMQANMQLMNKPALIDAERESIVRFLVAAAGRQP